MVNMSAAYRIVAKGSTSNEVKLQNVFTFKFFITRLTRMGTQTLLVRRRGKGILITCGTCSQERRRLVLVTPPMRPPILTLMGPMDEWLG